MGIWPLYRENLLQGPSHVSLAIPGVPSNISKSVGGTQPALLLFPNLDFLQSFIKGNVGIADGVLKGALLSNINALAGSATIPSVPSVPNIPSATIPNIPSAPNVPTGNIPAGAKVPDAPKVPDVPNIPSPPNIPKVPNSTEMGLKMFIKATELDIPDLDKYKKEGQIKIPAADIQLPPEYDYIGLKAMEKTIMTSIFETQKPYMDIAKVIISSMVKVEDIIARIMPLLSLNPLTSKSEKPIVKDGKSNGTKAIGYQNGLEIKKILAELEKLSKIGGALTVNKDGTTSKDKKSSNSSTDNPKPSDSDAVAQGKEWRIISTFYSTGDFDPTIEYLYTYNILPPDDEGVNNLTTEVVEPDNPFDKYKPKKIILGLFNSDGTPLNPNGLLKTKIGDKPEDIVDSKSKKADWVFVSPKWHFKPNEYIWPSFGGDGSGEPVYLWEDVVGGILTKESKKSPGNIWSIKKYKKGDKNQLNKLDAIEGDPVIVKFDASDTGEYTKYFKEFTTLQTNMSKDLDQVEKDAIVVDIMSKLDVQSHLQNVFLYGSGNSSFYKAPDIPKAMKKAFKPYQIYVSEAAKDPNLSGDGLIWVDPEADYEFKVIRVDVYPDAEYKNNIVKNDILKTTNLFSDGFYGNGTKDNPQEIEIIKRYSLTNLDVESYYIIEGIAVDDNKKTDGGKTNANASGDDGNKWYRLPHAIGAVIPFIKLLIDLAIKLFPSIAKLLKLFTNPMSFITDIISEKVGDAFAIFSKEAFKKFEDTKKIIDKKKDIIDEGRTSDYSGQIKKNFNTSPLVGHVHVDQFSISNPGKFKFLLDGVAMIPFEIFGKSLPFGMELKMANLIPDVPNINVPKVDVPKVPDINVSTSTLPTVPSVPSVPNVGIPSITLPKVKSPLKLILGKPGKAKTKDCDGSNQTPPATGKSNSDYLNALNNPATDNNKGNVSKGNANDKFVTSTWYSTGEFKKGVDYNYYYITEDTESILLEVDDLIKPSGSSSEDALPGGTNANDPDNTTVPMEDLQLAKEKLANALSKDPTNPLLKLKLSEVNQKILDSATLTQPILKLALGMVATPIKVVSCIVQWILDFFKSLINPMMLPAKIAELLSFKWIMKFFSPQGLLKTAGINFNPAIVQEWVSLASIPNANIPAKPELNTSKLNIPKVPDVNIPKVPDVNIPSVPSVTIPKVPGVNVPKVDIPSLPKVDVKIPKVDLGFSINSGTSDILKNIKPHNGKYALPDDFEIADLTKFLDVSFMASLPTYDAKTIRENPKLPFMLFDPILCFIEKLINAFIDFIWSTLGIEAVIPPPHIKLCKTKDAKEVNKLQNGESPKVPSDTAPDDTTEIDSTMPYQDKKASDAFVYEVQLPDGKIVTLKNDEELQNYLDQNRDLGFDLQF